MEGNLTWETAEALFILPFRYPHPQQQGEGTIEVFKMLQKFELAVRIDAITEYAHWKDGVQYVGTCGKTLEQAITELRREYE